MAGKTQAVSGELRRRTDVVILSASLDLFAERGYHGTSIRDIAAAAEIQTSTLYHHFSSKQQILVELMTRTMRDLTEQVEEAIVTSGDPVERLRAAIDCHIRFHADRRAEAFVADAELRALGPENRRVLVGYRDRYEQLFERVLCEGLETGVFAVADVRVAVLALMSMCAGVSAWFSPHGRFTLDEVAAVYTSLFLDGVTAGKHGSRRASEEAPGAGA